MIIRVLLAALAAGLVAGVLMTPLQYTKVIPLILYAEQFEGETHHDHGAQAASVIQKVDHVHSDGAAHSADHTAVDANDAEKAAAHAHPEAAEAANDAPLLLGRIWNTVLANLVTGAGYGLLMAGISMAVGVNVTFATGLIWGVLGWLCVQFLPALGLAPELPGFPEIDLAARKTWWVLTILASVVGFWLILLTKSNATRILGAALLIAPHVYGAPQPVDISSNVPAYLAAQYAVATLFTMLFFWVSLGLALGWFMDRAKLETP
jgi:cobalt transporter subunit CbtA